ncbi:MAG: hypothetical protein ABR505_08510, partial [Actinomycetota bacterium]
MKRPIAILTTVAALVAALLPSAPPVSAQAACNLPPGFYDSGGPLRFVFPNDPLYDAQWGLKSIDIEVAWV